MNTKLFSKCFTISLFLIILLPNYVHPQSGQKFLNIKHAKDIEQLYSILHNDNKPINEQKLSVDIGLFKKIIFNSNAEGLALIDSMVSVAYDTSFQKMKVSFSYDENGNITDRIQETVDEGTHSFIENDHIVYTVNGNIQSITRMGWANGSWRNYYLTIYLYDTNENTISYVTQNWDTVSNIWVNNYRTDFVYDANNNNTLSVSADWNNDSWVNSYKHEYTYDDNSNKTGESNYSWGGTDWQIKSITLYSYNLKNYLTGEMDFVWNTSINNFENSSSRQLNYDVNDYLINEIYQTWDANLAVWVYDSQTNYSYSENGNILNSINEDWDGNNWVKINSHSFTYDESNHLVNIIIRYDWNGNDWNNGSKYNYSYNSEGNCNGGSFEVWMTNHWVSADNVLMLPEYWMSRKKYNIWTMCTLAGYEFNVYYNSPTDAKTNINFVPKSHSLSQNYPNPFNPSTNISYQIPNSEFVTIKIYNVLGKEVSTLVNKQQPAGYYEVQFNASSLSSGVYFYRLITKNSTITKRMLLLE